MTVNLSALRAVGIKELHALAEQHQVDNIRNLQKQDLLFHLVKKQYVVNFPLGSLIFLIILSLNFVL